MVKGKSPATVAGGKFAAGKDACREGAMPRLLAFR